MSVDLDLFGQSKIAWFEFLLDLKAQSTHDNNKRSVRMYTKLFEVKICLNMNFKTDKENRGCDDIAFLSEIISDYRFWQVRSPTIEIPRQYPA
jgi:hypothetical protein